jgi:hypothetical protein
MTASIIFATLLVHAMMKYQTEMTSYKVSTFVKRGGGSGLKELL